MIKNRVKQIKNEILNSLQSSGEFIYLRDILISPIDDSYKQFIKAEVDWWIYEEKLLRKSNKSFCFEGMDYEDLNYRIDELYRQNARFSKDEFEELIEKAIKFRINFLCRPKYTLSLFVFLNEPTKLYDEVLLKLAYFSDYKYLTEGLMKCFNSNGYQPNENKLITKSIFENAISEIEDERISKMDFVDFVRLTEQLFEIFNYESQDDDIRIPIDVLKIFFEDKGLTGIITEFNKYISGNAVSEITKSDLVEFFAELAIT